MILRRYLVECDQCSRIEDCCSDGTPSQARNCAIAGGWTNSDDRDWCPGCYGPGVA